MKLTDLFLAELEREVAATRNSVARVPEGRNDWKPHEKSMRLGYLAALVATMPSWMEARPQSGNCWPSWNRLCLSTEAERPGRRG